MDTVALKSLLTKNFTSNFQIEEKKENLFQLFAPLFYPDGDMMDIFIQVNPSNPSDFKVCDCGLTLMRLSYDFDLDTPNKKNILENLLSENGASINNGNISISVKPEFLTMGVLQMTQVIAKTLNLKMLQRDIVNSLFFEHISDYVSTKLTHFNPQKDFAPLPNRDDLVVDYSFHNSSGKPVYLFAVNSVERAQLATISMLFFQKESLPFIGAVVHEDYDCLTTRARKSIMSAADKQFFDFADFEKYSGAFLTRTFNT